MELSLEFQCSLEDVESLIDKYAGGKDIPIIIGCTELSV